MCGLVVVVVVVEGVMGGLSSFIVQVQAQAQHIIPSSVVSHIGGSAAQQIVYIHRDLLQLSYSKMWASSKRRLRISSLSVIVCPVCRGVDDGVVCARPFPTSSTTSVPSDPDE